MHESVGGTIDTVCSVMQMDNLLISFTCLCGFDFPDRVWVLLTRCSCRALWKCNCDASGHNPFTWTSPGGNPDSPGLNGLSRVQPTAAWQCSLLHDSPWPSASLRYHAESQRCLLGAEVQARVRVCDTVNLHRWKAAASKVSPPLARTPHTWDLRVNAAQWVGDWNKRLWPPAALTSVVSTQLTPHLQINPIQSAVRGGARVQDETVLRWRPHRAMPLSQQQGLLSAQSTVGKHSFIWSGCFQTNQVTY